jgi:hypothetical protein
MSLPEVVTGGGRDILGFVADERPTIEALLVHHGGVLLRDFSVDGLGGFAATVRTMSGEPLEYSERSSPRSVMTDGIYTSTDYPATEEIFLHTENSYQASWPRTLYFFCLEPPTTGGATPLADTRGILAAIDPAVRAEFEARRWRVVRNFHQGFGPSWRRIFNTDDPKVVERYCRARGIELEWRGEDGLRTAAVRDAVHSHPVTGEPVWFNHVAFFHPSTRAPEVRAGLAEMFGEADLPTNTLYGDGGRIPDDVVDHLRECHRSARVRFDWLRGDVLIVDNMLAAHGREPFTGPRKIAVAMADLYTSR